MHLGKIPVFSVLALSVFLFCGQKEASIQWVGSLEEALAKAEESNQHVLFEFYTPTCKWCHALEESTFADPGLADFSPEFLWVRIDAKADTLAARNFHVFGYPTTILLHPSGQEVDRIVGYMRAEPFVAQVRDYLEGKGTLTSLQEMVRADSSDAEILFQLGEKHQQRGHWQPSLSLFERVVHLDPENDRGFGEEALYHQGEVLRRLKRFEQAVAIFRQLMHQYPQGELLVDAQLEIGYTYQVAERKDEAIVAYGEFLRDHPGHEYENWVNKQLDRLAQKS